MRDKIAALFWPISAPIRFIQDHFKATLLVLIILALLWPAGEIRQPNLKRIEVTGPIMSAHEVVEQVRDAQKNGYKGVLLIVDSPGGAVGPSVEIAYAIKRLAQTMPVVVYARGVMASGGYYAGIWGHTIIANPGADIGSIGVILQGANFKGLMDKVGIQPQVVKAGRFKEAGTPTRAWSEEERAELQRLVDKSYEMFVGDVASARKLNLAQKANFAEGRIFTAAEAKAIGLIDQLGTLFDAEEELIRRAKVSEPVWEEKSEMEKFFERIEGQSAKFLASLVMGGMW
ncbi:MAG: signal peptide peptidase SppA [Campylobacterales bacterium]